MAFAPRSAKNAKVRFGNTTFVSKKWTVTPKADKIDNTNSEGGGFGSSNPGILEADVEIDADWDGNNNPYDLPVGAQPGETIVNLKLFINDVTGPFWLFPTFNVYECPNDAPVRENVHITIKGSGTGQFFFPTGAA